MWFQGLLFAILVNKMYWTAQIVTYGQWSILAITKPPSVGSVRFYKNGRHFFTENAYPFYLCGKHFNSTAPLPCTFRIPEGSYNISSVAFTGASGRGRKLPGQTASIALMSTSQVDGVIQFVVIDSSTSSEDKVLENGQVIDRADYTYGRWNMKANFAPPSIRSVRFYLDGRYYWVDSSPPFSLCGDSNSEYFSCRLPNGNHTLKAIAYTELNGRGYAYPPFEMSFEIITSSQVEGVMSLSVVNAFDQSLAFKLSDGAVIDRSNFGEGRWNLEAHVEPVDFVKSVRLVFKWKGLCC